MPTYVYSCDSCGHGFETHQSITAPSLHECPACSGRVRRVIQAVGIVFKGGGFYKTDSRGSEAADKPAAEPAAAKPAAESAAAKPAAGSEKAEGEAKPAAPAAATPAAASTSTAGSNASASSAGTSTTN